MIRISIIITLIALVVGLAYYRAHHAEQTARLEPRLPKTLDLNVPSKPLILKLGTNLSTKMDPESQTKENLKLALSGNTNNDSITPDKDDEKPLLDTLSNIRVSVDDEGSPFVGYQFSKKSDAAKGADHRAIKNLNENNPIREMEEEIGLFSITEDQ